MICRFNVTNRSATNYKANKNKNSSIRSCDSSTDAVYIELDATENTPLLHRPIKTQKRLQHQRNCQNYSGIRVNEGTSTTSALSKCQIFKILLVVAIFLIGVSIGSYLLAHEKRRSYSSGYALDLVSYEAWSLMRNLPLGNLFPDHYLNISNIIVSQTGGNACDQSLECLELVRSMENDLKLPYNFLITANGQIYEVNGWKSEIDSISKQSSLIIGFVGDYTYDSPTREQLQSLISLIAESLRRKLIQNDYKLFGFKESQGEKLYKEISKFEHFSDLLQI